MVLPMWGLWGLGVLLFLGGICCLLSATKERRGGWFWVGVTLLSVSTLSWLTPIWAIIDEPEAAGDIVFTYAILTAVPIGIGIYGMYRGRKAPTVVIKMPWWFRVIFWPILLFGMLLLLLGVAGILAGDAEAFWIGGSGLLFTLLGIWMVGMTTKVTFNQPPGYMTVSRGHCPLFFWFLRTKRISREEARSAFVRSLQRTVDQYGGTVTAYEVRVVATSGKEVKLYQGQKWDVADNLAKRILDFAQEADNEAYRHKLDETRQAKLRPGTKFSMRVEEVFQATFATGALGMVVGGRVEHGAIRNGDEVEIRGYRGTKRAKVFEVDTLTGSGAAGEKVRLLIEDLTESDVMLGDILEKV